MDEGEIFNKKTGKDFVYTKNNLKAVFYTLIIFAIVVAIWVYTNPFFNKPEIIINSFESQPETIAKIDSINQSFKTMWSNVSQGFSKIKK